MADFKNEVDRLKSFKNWYMSNVDIRKITKAGFYYTDNDNIVKCAFCSVEISSWSMVDDPMETHEKLSPNCGFVKNLSVGNVPLFDCDLLGMIEMINYLLKMNDVNNTQKSSPLSGNICTIKILRKMSEDVSNITEIGPPRHIRYAFYSNRITSYTSCPKYLKLKPDILSRAGFYYTGMSDLTRCYHCGVGIYNWKQCDRSWEIHTRMSENCDYVLIHKGKKFIDEIRNSGGMNEIFSEKLFYNDKDEASIELGILEIGIDSLSTVPEPLENGTEARGVIESRNYIEPSSVSTLREYGNGSELVPISPRGHIMTTLSDSKNENSSRPIIEKNACIIQLSLLNKEYPICKICYLEEVCYMFIPCRHIVTCHKCILSLSTCIVCRSAYKLAIRIYIP